MRYRVYGLRLESNLPLEELEKSSYSITPDIQFVVERASPTLPALDPDLSFAVARSTDLGPSVEVYRSNDLHVMRWEGVVQFDIQKNGDRVVAHPLPSTPTSLVKHMLFGPILSYVMSLRGVISLHASAIALGGGAVGFLADPGVGKSTLAVSLAQRGHPILTDDVLALRSSPIETLAMPGFPWVNLTRESVVRVAPNLVGDRRDLDFEKARVFVDGNWAAFHREPLPLTALYLLARGDSTCVDIQKIRPREVLMRLVEHVSVIPIMERGSIARTVALLTPVCARVPVFQLTYPSNLASIPSVIDAIIASGGKHSGPH